MKFCVVKQPSTSMWFYLLLSFSEERQEGFQKHAALAEFLLEKGFEVNGIKRHAFSFNTQ
jgi:hypothetical protein